MPRRILAALRAGLVALGVLALPALAQTTPELSIAVPPVSVSDTPYMFEREAALADGAWKITADSAVAADLVVNLTVVENAGDFVPPALEGDQQVVILAGDTETTFNPVRDDRWDEDHGRLTVSLAAGAGYTLGSASSAVLRVRDDDFRSPPLTFSLSPASEVVVEGDPIAMEQRVHTIADNTFLDREDLKRALPGFEALRLKWGALTHLQTGDADVSVTASEHALAETEFWGYTAADGEAGLVGTRSLGNVAATDDSVAEKPERVLVALERSAGSAALLRAAAHPGADGFDLLALADRDFYRTALTVRDQPLMLELETIGIDEGQSVAVSATMMPPQDDAFTVTVTVSDAARAEVVGSRATLTFAAKAMESTGDVRIRAKRTAEGDGRADVVVTGTPSDTDVDASTASLIVSERGGSSGAILWETELTVGSYEETGELPRYGYVAPAQFPDLTANTAGTLADPTFSFQGVEYTVHRLSLTSGGGASGEQLGQFVAKSANGTPLPVGRITTEPENSPAILLSSYQLGLELEGADGVAWLRRLQLGPEHIGVLAPSLDWDPRPRRERGDRPPGRLGPHDLVGRAADSGCGRRRARLRRRGNANSLGGQSQRCSGAGRVRTRERCGRARPLHGGPAHGEQHRQRQQTVLLDHPGPAAGHRDPAGQQPGPYRLRSRVGAGGRRRHPRSTIRTTPPPCRRSRRSITSSR